MVQIASVLWPQIFYIRNQYNLNDKFLKISLLGAHHTPTYPLPPSQAVDSKTSFSHNFMNSLPMVGTVLYLITKPSSISCVMKNTYIAHLHVVALAIICALLPLICCYQKCRRESQILNPSAETAPMGNVQVFRYCIHHPRDHKNVNCVMFL